MNRLTRKTDGRDYYLYCRQVEFDNEVLERNDPLLYEEPQDFYNRFPYQTSEVGNEEKILNKLGQYEDLEDEIGCPLEVREKTLNSFYCSKFENDKKLYTYYVYAFNNEELFIRLIYSQYDEYYNEETTVLLKDYKKTWWLKEDLENDRN